MSTKIFIKGLAELQKNLARSKSIINKHYARAIKRGSLILERDLKTGGYVPVAAVQGGTLKGSIRTAIQPLKATIAPHTDYAIYVHEGTWKMKARPFLDTAIKNKKAEIEKEFLNATGLIVKELAK